MSTHDPSAVSQRRDRQADDPAPDLRTLRRDCLPARDLWPGIEPRLAPRRRRPDWRPMAGGFALAASVVAAITLRMVSLPEPVEERMSAVQWAALPPVVRVQDRALLKANLAIVDDARSQLESALQQQPDSAALRRLLVATQARERQLKASLQAL